MSTGPALLRPLAGAGGVRPAAPRERPACAQGARPGVPPAGLLVHQHVRGAAAALSVREGVHGGAGQRRARVCAPAGPADQPGMPGDAAAAPVLGRACGHIAAVCVLQGLRHGRRLGRAMSCVTHSTPPARVFACRRTLLRGSVSDCSIGQRMYVHLPWGKAGACTAMPPPGQPLLVKLTARLPECRLAHRSPFTHAEQAGSAGWTSFDMDQWCIMQPQSLKVQCEPYFAEDLIGAEIISRREFHLQVSLATARCCTLSSDTL